MLTIPGLYNSNGFKDGYNEVLTPEVYSEAGNR